MRERLLPVFISWQSGCSEMLSDCSAPVLRVTWTEEEGLWRRKQPGCQPAVSKQVPTSPPPGEDPAGGSHPRSVLGNLIDRTLEPTFLLELGERGAQYSQSLGPGCGEGRWGAGCLGGGVHAAPGPTFNIHGPSESTRAP